MGNKAPSGTIELKHIFHPKYKKQRVFVLPSILTSDANSLQQATLFTSTKEQVACVLRKIPRTDPEAKEIFKLFSNNETKFGTTAAYPSCIVTIFGMAEDQNEYTIVMEEMNTTWESIWYKGNKEKVDKERLALTCLQRVMELHNLGIAHRDLNMKNILINEDWTVVKLHNFGQTKDADASITSSNRQQFSDSLPYLAPERFQSDETLRLNEKEWKASDLYSLGVIMCEIVSGKTPFAKERTILYAKRKKEADITPYEYPLDNSLCKLVQDTLCSNNRYERNAMNIYALGDSSEFCDAVETYFFNNKVDKGIQLLKHCVEQCNFFACQLLIIMHSNGTLKTEHSPVSRDSTKKCNTPSNSVLEWLKKYEQHEDVHLLIAFARANGWGCSKNLSETFSICCSYKKSRVAQFLLGVCYYFGYGTAQDYSQAVQWFKLAADNGVPCAIYNLGLCYTNGTGVEKNYIQGLKMIKIAARKDIGVAQYNLGMSYYFGIGSEKDYSAAANWFRRAAEQGYANAQSSLAMCYFDGKGVPKDDAKAMELLQLAANQGNSEAQQRVQLFSKSNIEKEAKLKLEKKLDSFECIKVSIVQNIDAAKKTIKQREKNPEDKRIATTFKNLLKTISDDSDALIELQKAAQKGNGVWTMVLFLKSLFTHRCNLILIRWNNEVMIFAAFSNLWNICMWLIETLVMPPWLAKQLKICKNQIAVLIFPKVWCKWKPTRSIK